MIDKLAKLWRVSPDIISIKGDNLTVGGSLDLRVNQLMKKHH